MNECTCVNCACVNWLRELLLRELRLRELNALPAVAIDPHNGKERVLGCQRLASVVLDPYVAVQLHSFYLFGNSLDHGFETALSIQPVLQKSARLLRHSLKKLMSIKRIDLGIRHRLHQIRDLRYTRRQCI